MQQNDEDFQLKKKTSNADIIDILKKKVTILHSMLDDPHPVIFQWAEGVSELIKEIGSCVKPQWFKATKPLPDGWYGWRSGNHAKIIVIKVEKGRHQNYMLDGTDFSGEWCKIEFPD